MVYKNFGFELDLMVSAGTWQAKPALRVLSAQLQKDHNQVSNRRSTRDAIIALSASSTTIDEENRFPAGQIVVMLGDDDWTQKLGTLMQALEFSESDKAEQRGQGSAAAGGRQQQAALPVGSADGGDQSDKWSKDKALTAISTTLRNMIGQIVRAEGVYDRTSFERRFNLQWLTPKIKDLFGLEGFCLSKTDHFVSRSDPTSPEIPPIDDRVSLKDADNNIIGSYIYVFSHRVRTEGDTTYRDRILLGFDAKMFPIWIADGIVA
jgi:hypothetical protein